MKKMVTTCFIILCGLSLMITPVIEAGEVDILLDILVKKGVLTQDEAAVVKSETKAAVAAELKSGDSYAVPKWVQNMKFKGDVRVRYQYEDKENAAHSRNRGRVRMRLGAEAKVADHYKVGLGIATGGSDPRSTNQTFQNTFDSPDVRLDYAYGEYANPNGLKLVAGKFPLKPYLWTPTDLLWDSDIRPEGASLHYEREVLKDVIAFMNTGLWVLDENGANENPDPTMVIFQPGVTYKKNNIDTKLSGNFYLFKDIKDTTLDNSAGTNSNASVGLVSSYNSVGTSAEVGIKELFGGLPFNIDERIAIFGDFIHNTDDSVIESGLTGWAFGFKFGNKKVKKAGQWQLKYVKARLGKDAFPDTFPDSDRFGGSTDVDSHEVAFTYALAENVFLGLDYYRSEQWSSSSLDPNNAEDLFQADLIFKF